MRSQSHRKNKKATYAIATAVAYRHPKESTPAWSSANEARKPTAPPQNQIENPNPQAGTNNYYTQDGYSGGSYSACADSTQPGVGSVVRYLAAFKLNPNCHPGHYYLLNNYNPGYLGNGTVAQTGADQFTIPPSPVRSIGNVLMEGQVSFRWHGEDWSRYLSDPSQSAYCNICMAEAVYTYQENKKGKTAQQIRQGIMSKDYQNVDLQNADKIQ